MLTLIYVFYITICMNRGLFQMDFAEGKKLRVIHGYYYCGEKLFHRMVWEHYKGEIPKDHVIHHKNGDKLNNSLENLECLIRSDHSRLHRLKDRDKLSETMKLNSEKVHAWLKTDKGKKFLSEKAKKQWENREAKTFICEQCGKEFQAKHNRFVKYCGDNCVMRARNKTGVDNEERKCVICEKPFIINKYQKTKTCSWECRNKHIGNLRRKSK